MGISRTHVTSEKEAEAAVAEFLEMRVAILGRLSPEALRFVPGILERYTEERKQEPGKRLGFLIFLPRQILQKRPAEDLTCYFKIRRPERGAGYERRTEQTK